MTQGETLKIMAVLQATYPNFYRGMTRQDAEGVVALWADMFAEDSYNTVAAAVRAFIASDSKGFPPVVGQIKQRVAEFASRTAPGSAAVRQVCDKKTAWMRDYVHKERKLGRISSYAREHGMTWQEAKEALDG